MTYVYKEYEVKIKNGAGPVTTAKCGGMKVWWRRIKIW